MPNNGKLTMPMVTVSFNLTMVFLIRKEIAFWWVDAVLPILITTQLLCVLNRTEHISNVSTMALMG